MNSLEKRNTSNSNSDECWILNGPILTKEQLTKLKADNLKIVLDSQRIQEALKKNYASQGYSVDAIRYKKELFNGHYSDIYLFHVNVTSCDQNKMRKMRKVIAKIINKFCCPKKSNYENEFQVCNFLKTHPHRNIIHIKDVIEFKNCFVILMSFGGEEDLNKFLSGYNNRHMMEALALDMFFNQMAQAMIFLHSNKIVHRDIKPENIMVYSNKENSSTSAARDNYRLRIIDFGFAKLIDSNQNLASEAICTSHKGMLEYMAPELMKSCFFYDAYKTDVYAMGVILYLMLFGKHPYILSDMESLSLQEIMKKYAEIKLQPVKFPDEIAIEEETKLLIKQMLNPKPELRKSFRQILDEHLK